MLLCLRDVFRKGEVGVDAQESLRGSLHPIVRRWILEDRDALPINDARGRFHGKAEGVPRDMLIGVAADPKDDIGRGKHLAEES